MLYPVESECREIKDLSGIWRFKIDPKGVGREEMWFSSPLTDPIAMPVPASYNDLGQDASVRDFAGDAWYETTFFVPASWKEKRIALRVGSATHCAELWINGSWIARHKGGYLPFEVDVSATVDPGRENMLCIAVNNVLDWTTLPPGEMTRFKDELHPDGYSAQDYFHDFFNYAGIHRRVRLCATPRTYIADIAILSDILGEDGIVRYEIDIEGGERSIDAILRDAEFREVARGEGPRGELIVANPRLWEPENPHLYQLTVRTFGPDRAVEDAYRLPVGIRTIRVCGKEFLLNGRPVYFRGFGKHEDSDIRGKGDDDVVNVKDFNCMEWIGANSFRCSHYPYSEEILNLADSEGFMVIDEAPAVGMNFFNTPSMGKVFADHHIGESALSHHLEVMKELVRRDRNHPCVVMWSVANEAATWEEGSERYFARVILETRTLDPSRPITIVESAQPEESKVSRLVDVVCVNRYFSWYSDPGRLDLIEFQLERDLKKWFEHYGKPVILTEYGADALAGFHQDPPTMFSEEYQCELLERYHRVLDRLDFIVGEHVWNFADFATKQGITRISGNRKGIFTRQRQPKMAARLLRERWKNQEAERKEDNEGGLPRNI